MGRGGRGSGSAGWNLASQARRVPNFCGAGDGSAESNSVTSARSSYASMSGIRSGATSPPRRASRRVAVGGGGTDTGTLYRCGGGRAGEPGWRRERAEPSGVWSRRGKSRPLIRAARTAQHFSRRRAAYAHPSSAPPPPPPQLALTASCARRVHGLKHILRSGPRPTTTTRSKDPHL